MKAEIIELGKFKHTKDEDRYAQPFAIYFVYTEDGRHFIVKGMSNEVKKYVNRHYPRSIYYYTYWHQKESRGGWGSPMSIYMMPRIVDGRQRYEISIHVRNGQGIRETSKTIAIVRRIPRRWLKEYSEAQEKCRHY